MEHTMRLKWMENILQCMLGAVVCVRRLLSCLYFPLFSFHPLSWLFLSSDLLPSSSSFSVFFSPLTSRSSLFLLSSPSLFYPSFDFVVLLPLPFSTPPCLLCFLPHLHLSLLPSLSSVLPSSPPFNFFLLPSSPSVRNAVMWSGL